jgi:Na+-translocating ferredoxin:NAD+ oxidoreductase subunit G
MQERKAWLKMSLEGSSNSILKIAMNLTCACIISGIIIAGTYYFTSGTAEQKSIEMRDNAMKSLVKDADNFKPVSGKADWFVAEKDGKTIAYIVPSKSKGYGGMVEMLVAVDTDGKVLNFSILESEETPGLGDKASKEPFHSQFIGKFAGHLKVVKDAGNKEDIQAISGATISSNAVTLGVKEAVLSVEDFLKEGQ